MKTKSNKTETSVPSAPKPVKGKKNHRLKFLTSAQFCAIVVAEREVCIDDFDVTCRVNPLLCRDMIFSLNLIDNDITKYYY